jgi:hypothetical protein
VTWRPYVNRDGNREERGTEGGVIVRDEAHDPYGARITLERDASAAPFAITCGLYGWMLHTRFFRTRDDAMPAYDAMKVELSALVSLVPSEADPEVDAKCRTLIDAIGDFVGRNP